LARHFPATSLRSLRDEGAIFPAAPVDSGGHSVEHLPRGTRVAWGICGCLHGLLCERPALLGSSGAFVDAGLVVGTGA